MHRAIIGATPSASKPAADSHGLSLGPLDKHVDKPGQRLYDRAKCLNGKASRWTASFMGSSAAVIQCGMGQTWG
ncbi:hypothetical protein GCM10022279_12850 [Comamonas faecalis]|uniref:Uncharacterized protein n=1 Tax=Comamonas faecalis TaxID=1387849 RepID=A0ABP7R1E0_9BURK